MVNNQIKNQQKENRSAIVDLLKGICILFVIITHFSWQAIERRNLLFPFWVDMAIPIFLVITGYLFSLSYQKKNIESIESAFQVNNWLKSFIRFILPYIIIYLLEITLKILQDTTLRGLV